MYYPWWMSGSTPYAPQMNYTAAFQAAQDYEKQLKQQAQKMNAEEIEDLRKKINRLQLQAAMMEQNRKLIEGLRYVPPGETSVLYADNKVTMTVESHPLGETKYYAHTNRGTEKAESVRTEEEDTILGPIDSPSSAKIVALAMCLLILLLGIVTPILNRLLGIWVSPICQFGAVFTVIESFRKKHSKK